MPASKKRSLPVDTNDESLDMEVKIKKPLQPSVTGSEFLAAKEVRPFLSTNQKSKRTKKEIMKLAGYLSNRGPIVFVDEPAAVVREGMTVVSRIDLLNSDPEFVRIADPILGYINWAATASGVAPADYMVILTTVNALQGGNAEKVGAAGEPIQYVAGLNFYLHLDSDETFERLVGALKVSHPEVKIIRTNPTQVVLI